VSQEGPGASGIQDQPLTGYCVGNNSAQTQTWDGLIAQVQVFNTILSDANADAALRIPGSVTSGLRLYLPMTKASDVFDSTANTFHGTGTDLSNGSSRPEADSVFKFGVLDQIQRQIVIPSKGSEPGPGVRGLGTATKLRPDPLLTGGARFITTESWGASTVIEPTVRDVYLDGNQGFTERPSGTASPVCHAIAIDGDAAEVTGCKVYDFAGDGIRVNNTIAEAQPLVRMPRVRDNKIAFCYTGIHAGAVDTQVSGNRVANCRDYGLYVPQDAGAVQSEGNHFFGLSKAIYVHNAANFNSTNDVFSDSAYGFNITGYSHYALVTGGYSQRCWVRNIDVESSYNSFVNCRVRVTSSDDSRPDVVGVEFASRGNQFIGGSVYTSAEEFQNPEYEEVNPGATAFLFTNDGTEGASQDNRIETIVYSPTGQGGQTQHDICVRFADASTGNQIDITIPYGFYHTNTRLLVINDGAQSGMKNNKITFRGKDLGPAVSAPGSYVDIGTGGIDSSNTVTIIDSDTGASTTLSANTPY
jgi:hypothetical protein